MTHKIKRGAHVIQDTMYKETTLNQICANNLSPYYSRLKTVIIPSMY